MIPHSVQTIGNAIAEILSKEPVTLAYLHGSYSGGQPDEESDIDIAVLADASLTPMERHKMQLHLMHTLSEVLAVPLEMIDLVILQDVPVLLRYNAIRNGTCIYQRSRSDRVFFEVKVEQEFDDERFYLERENTMMLDRILSHQLR